MSEKNSNDDVPYAFWEKPDEPFEFLQPELIRCMDWTKRICSQLALIESFPEHKIDDVYALLVDPESHSVVAAAHFPHQPLMQKWDGRRWGTKDGVTQKRPDAVGVLITDIWKRKKKKRCEVVAAICDDRIDSDYAEMWLVQQLLDDCRELAWECVTVRMLPEDPTLSIYQDLGFAFTDVTSDGAYIYTWSPKS